MTNPAPSGEVIDFPLWERMADVRQRPDRLAIIYMHPHADIFRYCELMRLAPDRVRVLAPCRS